MRYDMAVLRWRSVGAQFATGAAARDTRFLRSGRGLRRSEFQPVEPLRKYSTLSR
jgi:hypothetical protein